MNKMAIFMLALMVSSTALAKLDPRVKIMGKMALYGTSGGVLLGTAFLAFGANGRTVAKGASLGLYTGLLFGSYLLTSHYLRQKEQRAPDYPDMEGPYEGVQWTPKKEVLFYVNLAEIYF